VERVAFEPWALTLAIEGLRVAAASGAGDQFTLQRLYINAELQSVLRLAPVIDAIAIEQPRLNLRHLGGGRYDVDDILQRPAQPVPAEPGDPSRFALHNIRISGGEVSFIDEPLQLTHQLDKLALPFLNNLPSRREVVTQPQVSFALNGSAFDSRAASTPFADDRQTEASLNIPALDMPPYLPYWPAAWPVRPTAGVLWLSLKLVFEQRERPQVVLSGTAALAKFRVEQTRSGGSPSELLAWDRLAVAVRRAEPLARRIDMESIAQSRAWRCRANPVGAQICRPCSTPGLPRRTRPRSQHRPWRHRLPGPSSWVRSRLPRAPSPGATLRFRLPPHSQSIN
jgi:hypothetical protein